MKKQVKNLFALFLTASMAVSLVPADAFAAVHDAVKDATTTTAYEKVEAEKKAAQPKAGSAEAAIQEALYTNTDEVDLSKYNLTERKAEKLTDKSLGENKDTNLVDVTYETNEAGKVTSVNVEKDDTYATALDEIATYAEEDNGKSEATQESVGESYMRLQTFYEENPDYFGIAAPYFTSKATTNPIAALLSILQQQWSNDDSSAASPDLETIQMVVDGYYQTLMLSVQVLGNDLLAAKDEALKQLDDSMTKEEKLLVLNDWLGNYCTFDMSQIQKNNKQSNSETAQQASLEDATETLAEVDAQDGDGTNITPEQARALLLNGKLTQFVEGTAFGALVRRNALCIGYSAAYTYLVQWAFPDIYREGGTADGAWKTKNEVNGQEEKKDDEGNVTQEKIDPTYIIDFVKIFWNSQVEMLGEKNAFQNSHYFNAVRLDPTKDDKWYYIDPCYNDIYVECMGRNRVETDGNMTHSYFLISHDSLADQFKGNFDKIETLYENKSSDTTYEKAWFTKAQGPISYDKEKKTWYYVRNTSNYSFGSGSQGSYQEGSDQLVSRPWGADFAGSDNVTILIDYAGKETGKVESGAELVTKGAKIDDDVNDKIYAGLTHTSAYYDGAVYLNVNNEILKYDLASNKIKKVKEYNTVSAKQNTDMLGTGINSDFTGMTFEVTSDKNSALHTVENHPLAGIAIKSDGKLYASIATNYCSVDEYATEQTNYNSDYVKYNFQGKQYQQGGNNDNQEFMWSADFVETLDMKHVAGGSHTYETVTVAPTCENDGFTENRCTTCGAVEVGSKIVSEDAKATGHHYIKYKDRTYTKKSEDKDAKYIVVDAIVCADCMKAIPKKSSNSDELQEVPEGTSTDHTYAATTKWNADHSVATMTVKCDHCLGKKLDFLTEDNVIPAKDKNAEVTAQYEKAAEGEETGNCTKGGDVTYTAKLTVAGKEYTAEEKETVTAGTAHNYVPTFTWNDDHTASVTFKCSRGDTEVTKAETVTGTKDEAASTKATCEAGGEDVYVATAKDPDEKEHKGTQEIKLPAIGHKYGEPTFNWSEDGKECTAKFTCENDKTHTQEEKCTVTKDAEKSTDATCTEAGKAVYVATVKAPNGDTEYTKTKEVEVAATGHDYAAPEFKWTEKDSKMTCEATFVCRRCGNNENKPKDAVITVPCEVTSEEKDATCTEAGEITYTATCTFGEKDYTTTKKVKTTNALGHDYGEPTFGEWTEKDGKMTCEATFTCKNDASHVETVSCEVTSEGKDATCTEAGSVTYTATATVPGGTKTYTNPVKKEVKGEALGHDYAAPEFKWAEKDSKMTCEATFVCRRCGNNENKPKDAVITVPCEVKADTTDATYTAAGKVVYKATCTFKGKDYFTTKEVKVVQKDSKAKFAKTSYNLYSTQSGKVSLVSDYKQDGIVSIKSSNPSKVSVNTAGVIKAGVVKGKAVKVTITAVVKSGKTIKTVVTVAPTKITLNATSVPLQLKKSTSVIKVAKATLPGDQIASWSTSNKKVVTVSKSGKITAKKVGTAVVRITMKSGATAKCKVKVQKAAVKLTKIAVNSKKVNLNLKKGPKTYKLTATKAPITVVNKVTFTTSNKKVAVVSKSGKIRAKKAGKAVITVKCAKKVKKVTVVVKAK